MEDALKKFNVNVSNKICLDIGSSTGGFTEVLLERNAKMVYSVDVGYGQLDWKLRNNKKVIVLEKTNARYLNNDIIKNKVDLMVCDVSFISIKKIIPNIIFLMNKNFNMIILIKPQFEVGKSLVGKGGIVKDESTHKIICDDIIKWSSKILKLKVNSLIKSKITGQKGNKEFFINLSENDY